MKITKQQLKQIIYHETKRTLKESNGGLIEVGEGEITLVYEPGNKYITVESSWMDSYPQISIELFQEMYKALLCSGTIK